jgi:adenylosuccinate synthase
MPNLQVVVGGQYGSEAKGHVTAYLCHPSRFGDGLAIRVGGSQAGHTAYDPQGRRWPLRHVPVAAVVNPHAQLAIAAGSEVDLGVLNREINDLEAAGHRVRNRLVIDPAATIISHAHKQTEATLKLNDRLGSTAKGVGAARASRIMRSASTITDAMTPPGVRTADVADLIRRQRRQILIEGVQGWGLGLHTRFYPRTTSSDCRAIDFAAMAGVTDLDLLAEMTIWVVFRPYPIRVAGNSGPLHGETTWEQLGLPPEQTTVTQKTRRVGTWDPWLALSAVRANGGPHPRVQLALTMADQLDPTVTGVTDPAKLTDTVTGFIHRIERDTHSLGQTRLVGTSPTTITDLFDT